MKKKVLSVVLAASMACLLYTSIQAELGLPVKYVGVGEKIDDLQKFNSTDFVNALFDVKQD